MMESYQNRRRRRVAEQRPPGTQNTVTQLTASANLSDKNTFHHYYDDDSDDDKGHHHGDDRIFKGSCSFGQFVLNPCLCLFNTATSCIKRRHRRKRRPNTRMRTIAVVFGTIAMSQLFGLQFLRYPRSLSLSMLWGRPLANEAFNHVPVTIPILDFEGTDIGGWGYLRRFFYPKNPLDLSSIGDPDFGGLDIVKKRNIRSETIQKDPEEKKKHRIFSSSLNSNQLLPTQRIIHPEDAQLAAEYWERFHENDPHFHKYDLHAEEREDEARKCRTPGWAQQYYPQCNSFHELGLERDYESERAKKPGYDESYDSFYISHGYYRDVWVVHQPSEENLKTVVKMTRWKHQYAIRTYWNVQKDAMVMERLTGSPRIVDIYGHCGTAVWVEAIPHELEEVIIHGKGMAKQADLHDEDGLKPLNNYTVEEKLDIALIMAESLADLHGFRDGVIVHDDVQLCQWLRTRDGRIKLGDFNRAEVMDYDIKEEKYCRYFNGESYGNYRAPEEFRPTWLNEQIDVFSFGNNIYALLTGLWVFYEIDDDETVHKELVNGTRAFIDPRWKKRSFIESKLVDVMEACWKQEPKERITIFQAIKMLREIKEQYERENEKIRLDA